MTVTQAQHLPKLPGAGRRATPLRAGLVGLVAGLVSAFGAVHAQRGDVVAVARVGTLHADPGIWARASAQAQRTIVERHSPRSYLDALLPIYATARSSDR